MASSEDFHSDDGMDGEEGEDDLLLLGVLRDMPRELRIETCKVGGRPTWLHLSDLPSAEDLCCPVCSGPTVLLCQVYAPLDHLQRAFHRTIFVFLCLRPSCHSPPPEEAENGRSPFVVLRCQLPRANEFYPADAPDEGGAWDRSVFSARTPLCRVCGCAAGGKRCAGCGEASYCSREHQAADWKRGGHKAKCKGKGGDDKVGSLLLPEFEVETLEGEDKDYADDEEEESDGEGEDSEEEMEKLKAMQRRGEAGAMSPEEVLKAASEVDEDPVFQRFRRATANTPGQVLRYQRGGRPLWIARPDESASGAVPRCESCSAERYFEFQVMPQLLSRLKMDADVDWGTLAVYTCAESCDAGGKSYKKEFLCRQTVSK